MFRWKNKKLEQGQVGHQVFTNMTAYVILLLAMGAMVFFGVCSPQGQFNGGPRGAAAKVGGQEISYEEFRRAYESSYRQYSQVYADSFDPSALKLAQNVLEDLINRRLVYEQARAAGFIASREKAEDQIFDIFKDEKGNFDPDEFKQRIRAYGYTEASLLEEIRREMTTSQYRRFLGEVSYYATPFAEMDYKVNETKLELDFLKLTPESVKVSVTGKDIDTFLDEAGKKKVKDYYEKNISDFNKEKRVKASHILISFKGAKRASGAAENRSKEDAKKIADSVYAEVTKPGTDFATAAKKYTDEASGKTKGGDLGFFAKADMVPSFSEAAFGMKPGQISAPVESEFGYHIIKVTDVQPAVEKSLEKAEREIAAKLLEREKKPTVLNRRAEELLAELKAGKNPTKLISEYGLSWQDTGEFSPESRSIPNIGTDEKLLSEALKLEKVGSIAPEIFDVSGNKYLIRLKMKKDASLAGFKGKKEEEIKKNANYAYAGSAFRALNDQYEEKLKQDGKITMNKEYLAIDQNTKKDSGG